MMKSFRKLARRFRRDDEGVTLVEYGIGVALAVVVGTFMLGTLGTEINNAMDDAVDCMDGTECVRGNSVAPVAG